MSARTLLRDRCFPRLPTASQEEQELQTSQGSVNELAGLEQGSCHHGGFAGPLGSRATSVQRVPFPARRDRDSCGGREGGDYSSPRGLQLPGERRMSPALPSHQEWIFSSLRPAGTSLKGPEKAPSLPSSAKGPGPPPQAPL